MFILRKITGSGVEINQEIGSNYTHINRFTNYPEFQEIFRKFFEKNHVADLDETSDSDTQKCYAFICNENFTQPLYMTQQNYIMTESGKTFSNLTMPNYSPGSSTEPLVIIKNRKIGITLNLYGTDEVGHFVWALKDRKPFCHGGKTFSFFLLSNGNMDPDWTWEKVKDCDIEIPESPYESTEK